MLKFPVKHGKYPCLTPLMADSSESSESYMSKAHLVRCETGWYQMRGLLQRNFMMHVVVSLKLWTHRMRTISRSGFTGKLLTRTTGLAFPSNSNSETSIILICLPGCVGMRTVIICGRMDGQMDGLRVSWSTEVEFPSHCFFQILQTIFCLGDVEKLVSW